MSRLPRSTAQLDRVLMQAVGALMQLQAVVIECRLAGRHEPPDRLEELLERVGRLIEFAGTCWLRAGLEGREPSPVGRLFLDMAQRHHASVKAQAAELGRTVGDPDERDMLRLYARSLRAANQVLVTAWPLAAAA